MFYYEVFVSIILQVNINFLLFVPNKFQLRQKIGLDRESNPGLSHPKREFYHLTIEPISRVFIPVSRTHIIRDNYVILFGQLEDGKVVLLGTISYNY